ncbi:MAG: hypothetical protein IBX64_07845 [Actinobacteria bacterium]|nr:hypothetical protein [Actinomycetota bacterium]
MSPRVSTKAPISLLNIRKYPDVYKALLLNAQVIARDIKEHYLVETDNLAGKIKEGSACTLNHQLQFIDRLPMSLPS